MIGFMCLFVLMSVQSTLQQQYSYQQPIVAIPSEVCVGGAVTLRCETVATAGNISQLVSASFTRDGDVIRSDTPNHMFLITGIVVIGVVVSDVTLSDDGVEYTCTTPGAPLDFESSLTLNVSAPPMTAPNITGITPLSSTSFTVSWTITDLDHNYIVTWTNFYTCVIDNMTVPENTSSHMVTGLNDVRDYAVSVTANNSCGMVISEPVTVYDTVPMGVIVPEEHITSKSFVVQWDRVSNYTGNYIVKWYGEDGSSGMNIVNGLSDTVTDLTALASYNVTVAVYTCLGAGQFSDIIMTMTNDLPPTSPPSPTPATTSTLSNAITSMTIPTETPDVLDEENGDDNTVVIVVVVVIVVIIIIITTVIIIIVIYIKKRKDSDDSGDTQDLKSPTSTGGGHTASVQPASSIVPHQAAASGEEYALTTKVVTKPQQQQPTEEYAVVDKDKKHAAAAQGIQYAELQALPSSGDKPPPTQGPTSTYAMVA